MNSATFRQMQVFVTVVDFGSITSAADRLGISQPAVSSHIRALEKQLGAVLIEHRPGRSASVTLAGSKAYRHASSILAQLTTMSQEISAKSIRRSHRIVLLTSRYAMRFWLSQAIEEFVTTFPEVRLDIQSHGFHGMAERIREGHADLAYYFSFGRQSSLLSEPIHHEPRSLFVAPNHPLASMPTPMPAQIAGYPFIIPPPATYFGECNISALASMGVKDFPVLFESVDRDLRIQFALEGKAVVYLFDRVVADRVQEGRLVRIGIPLPMFEFHEAVRTMLTPSLLIDHLRQTIRRHFGRS